MKRVRPKKYSTVFSRTSNAPAIYPTGSPTYILASQGSSTILQAKVVEFSHPLEEHKKSPKEHDNVLLVTFWIKMQAIDNFINE